MGAATSGATYSLAQSVMYCFVTFWTGEHMNTVPLTGAMAVACLPLAGAGIVGVQRLLQGTGRISADRAPLLIMGAAVLCQLGWALAVPAISGVGGMTPGRYLYPVAVPLLVLLTAGLWALLKPELSRTAVAAMVMLGIINLALYAGGYTAWYQERRYDPLTATMSEDLNLSGAYSGVEINVDRLLVDHTQRIIWLHLVVKNHRTDTVDWWSEPLVFFPNGEHLWASYAGSTPFPETLQPQSEYAGWVKLRALQPPLPGTRLHLVFEDIAVNGYRGVGTLRFDLVVR
jgi:hypothetical protein